MSDDLVSQLQSQDVARITARAFPTDQSEEDADRALKVPPSL